MNNDIMIYGLQRSGTNYVEALLVENFEGVQIWNEHYPDCLPTQKHFRLYDEKHLIPSLQFQNNFLYDGFSDFDKHVSRLTEKSQLSYVVVVKHPLSWYLSYFNWASKKHHIDHRKKDVNGHFILEWNLFMKKWLAFQAEAPGRVHIVKYEDLIADHDTSLEAASSYLKLTKRHSDFFIPEKVGMSKGFGKKRLDYYKKKSYLDELPETHYRVIRELVDDNVLSDLGYEMKDSQPTYSHQKNYKATS
ncbi:MAG: hypothetical protein HN542_04625 [Flavobacteriales bacterium]|jgi:hypothetical protein|nr:hypothetical protein [Flavobacteriales bacterium]MBT3963869.1 hypothetical protein [Flavobacteriales bacterium]MBT4706223.1 hypothetical protein [Flavobacteriales bacterium]MBT4931408.1 hypothetical protein [Flavobacteriales bacterium]MBT5133158.1 hypothetical protein [Flavobacteriales bacterium]